MAGLAVVSRTRLAAWHWRRLSALAATAAAVGAVLLFGFVPGARAGDAGVPLAVGSPSSSQSQSPSQAAPSLQSPSTSTRPSGVLVSYRQVGGLAGEGPSLVVFDDRRARMTLRGCAATFELGPTAWRGLRARLRGARLHEIAGTYPPPPGSADMITHVIRSGGEVVWIALPNSEHRDVARQLRPLLEALNRLVSTGQRHISPPC